MCERGEWLTWLVCGTGGEEGERDVDIGDDVGATKFAPVVIDNGRESSSSGSDSSDSGSSDSGKCGEGRLQLVAEGVGGDGF